MTGLDYNTTEMAELQDTIEMLMASPHMADFLSKRLREKLSSQGYLDEKNNLRYTALTPSRRTTSSPQEERVLLFELSRDELVKEIQRLRNFIEDEIIGRQDDNEHTLEILECEIIYDE